MYREFFSVNTVFVDHPLSVSSTATANQESIIIVIMFFSAWNVASRYWCHNQYKIHKVMAVKGYFTFSTFVFRGTALHIMSDIAWL